MPLGGRIVKYTPEQEKAIKCVDKDLVVTAGAGAGKTRVLVDRIIYIIEQGLAKIDEIVAITYTRKAALEIMERLRSEIKRRGNSKEFINAKEMLGIAYIGTIHGFCLRLLQENPVEADLDPSVQILEQPRAMAILKESVSKAIIKGLEDEKVFDMVAEFGYDKLSSELFELLIKLRNQGLNGVPRECIQGQQEKTIAGLIKRALNIYTDKKSEMNVIDYEDQLQMTQKMLKGHTEVLEYYREKFKFIMVDEYQDLNFVQDSILRMLGQGTNLFVVGDKKQSIFGFRGARVELFGKLFSDLKRKGQDIVLRDNFRSSKGIIQFVNKCFDNLMEDYESIVHHRPVSEIPAVHFLLPKSDGNMDDRKKLEGCMIAGKILEMIYCDDVKVFDKDKGEYRRPVFGDFTILLRKRTHRDYFIKALEDAGIPYYVAESGSIIEESRCVRDLINALETIECKDKIALYGTLTRLMGADDEKLAEFVMEYKNLEYGLEGKALKQDFKSLNKAFDVIIRWMGYKERLTLYELIKRIIDDTGLLDMAASIGEQEISALFKFLDYARDCDEMGCNLEEFMDELNYIGEEVNEPFITEEANDAVKFMTIHSSKGLEFPIVILADAASNFERANSTILFEPEAGIAVKNQDKYKKDQDKYKKVKEFIEQKERQEAKRLLYVALTRARDYLVISGELKSGNQDNFIKWLYRDEYIDEHIIIKNKPEEFDAFDGFNKQSSKQKPVVPRRFKETNIKVSNVLSVTSLAEYTRCPRRFYLKNILGLYENVFFDEIDQGSDRLPAYERGEIVHKILEKHPEFQIGEIDEIVKGSSEKELCKQDEVFIKQCLENYINSCICNLTGKSISEMPIFYRLSEQNYMSGKIDRIILNEDKAVIIDFKTNEQMASDVLKSYELQLKSYALAIGEILDIPVNKGYIASLYEGVMYEVDVTRESLSRCKILLEDIFYKTSNFMSAESFEKAKSCDYCGYKGEICK